MFFKRYNINEVFTPTTSAKLTYIERSDISEKITKALLMRGMQLILYGYSGSGKTTIIQNILAKQRKRYIITNCISGNTLDDLIHNAFDQLNPYYCSTKSKKIINGISKDIKANYHGLSTSINSFRTNENTSEYSRIIPVQITPQRLVDYLGYAKVIWIIEDFHKIHENERQKFSNIMKVFLDNSNKFPDTRLIAIGVTNTARTIIKYDKDMENRVKEIEIPLLSNSEINKIILLGQQLLNISFSEETVNEVVNYSNSIASVCHQLCFNMCYDFKLLKTQLFATAMMPQNLLEAAFISYIDGSSDSFKSIFDKALSLQDKTGCDSSGILKAMCSSPRNEVRKEEIFGYKFNRKTYKSTFLHFLFLLTTAEYNEILRFDKDSGKYMFSNIFLKAYGNMYFSKLDNEYKKDNMAQSESFTKLLNILIREEMYRK